MVSSNLLLTHMGKLSPDWYWLTLSKVTLNRDSNSCLLGFSPLPLPLHPSLCLLQEAASECHGSQSSLSCEMITSTLADLSRSGYSIKFGTPITHGNADHVTWLKLSNLVSKALSLLYLLLCPHLGQDDLFIINQSIWAPSFTVAWTLERALD
jgi:hypothetical protein